MKKLQNKVTVIRTEMESAYWREKVEQGSIYYLLYGGLGNQLFGLSAANILYQYTGKRIIVDIVNCEHLNSHDLPEVLFFLNFEDRMTFINSGTEFLNDLKSVAKSILEFRNLKDAHGVIFGWQPDIGAVRKSGLFLPLQKELTSSSENRAIIGVHIRQGDYKNYPYLGILSFSYYKRALKIAHKVHPKAEIIFYYDDIRAASKIAKKLGVPFRDGNKISDIDTLISMSQVDFLICANSTFSFWAAYLGEIPAIYPFPWFLTDPSWGDSLFTSKDIKVKQWIFPKTVLCLQNLKLKASGKIIPFFELFYRRESINP